MSLKIQERTFWHGQQLSKPSLKILKIQSKVQWKQCFPFLKVELVIYQIINSGWFLRYELQEPVQIFKDANYFPALVHKHILHQIVS